MASGRSPGCRLLDERFAVGLRGVQLRCRTAHRLIGVREAASPHLDVPVDLRDGQAGQLLRARADVGYLYAADRLADLLARRGDQDQAEQFLRAQADAGARDAQQLSELLKQQGREE